MGKGLEHSADGGHTFHAVSAAPAPVAVDEPEPGLLVALAADGRVLSSRDGRTWTEHGHLPQGGDPTVLTAVTAQRLLAPDDTVYQSPGAGRT